MKTTNEYVQLRINKGWSPELARLEVDRLLSMINKSLEDPTSFEIYYSLNRQINETIINFYENEISRIDQGIGKFRYMLEQLVLDEKDIEKCSESLKMLTELRQRKKTEFFEMITNQEDLSV